MKEAALTGGRTTEGVVRVGDTVRRPSGPHSPFVARLLRHLHDAGFDAAPKSLGTDDLGRDVFGFIEGIVPIDLGWHGDPVLAAAACLIRRFHDTTVSLMPKVEVICHNDLSPCNFVFVDAVPRAIIDFDAAAPGRRLDDLGYAAWLWLDIGNAAIEAAEQKRRLNLFVSAYADDIPVREVVEAMTERQQRLIEEGNASGQVDMSRWASDCLAWTREQL